MPAADRRLRVLHVMGRLEAHGTERQLVGMLEAAHGVLWDASLLVLRTGYRLTDVVRAAGVPVRELDHASDANPRRLLAVRRLVAEGGFDVVHSSLWGANVLTRLSLLGPGRPAVVISERSVEEFRHPAARGLDRLLRSATDHYVGNSRDVTEFVRRAHGVPPERVSLVRNGLDGTVFYPASARVRGAGPLRIGTVGRLKRMKGHDVLLTALRTVLAACDVEVVIAGEGPEREALELAAAGLPVQLPGEIATPADVADFLRTLDVFVMPSRFEGLPNAVLEAVACGLPVVATAVPGMAEAAGPAARLVPAEDPDALAAALVAALAALPAVTVPVPRAPVRGYHEVAVEHLEVFKAAHARRSSSTPPAGPPLTSGQLRTGDAG